LFLLLLVLLLALLLAPLLSLLTLLPGLFLLSLSLLLGFLALLLGRRLRSLSNGGSLTLYRRACLSRCVPATGSLLLCALISAILLRALRTPQSYCRQ
jgi:hypothetical protein